MTIQVVKIKDNPGLYYAYIKSESKDKSIFGLYLNESDKGDLSFEHYLNMLRKHYSPDSINIKFMDDCWDLKQEYYRNLIDKL